MNNQPRFTNLGNQAVLIQWQPIGGKALKLQLQPEEWKQHE